MKKILALVMAIVMMMAIAVPAFAEDKSVDQSTDLTVDANANKATVSTTWDGADAEYMVTFPASTTFTWDNKDAVDVSYSVDTQLPFGASLKVSVAADNNGIMNLVSDPTSAYTLTYALTGGTAEKEFTLVTTGGVPDEAIEVSIADYSQVPPDVYQGTITYTVVYTPAPEATA